VLSSAENSKTTPVALLMIARMVSVSLVTGHGRIAIDRLSLINAFILPTNPFSYGSMSYEATQVFLEPLL
jgi:hypothetical protein